MEKINLGIFDVDGTIRIKERIPREIIKGFNSLWESGVITTVATGRGYVRVREILGNFFPKIISQSAPIGVENGGRILNTNGDTNIHYFPLTEEEIRSSLLLMTEKNTKFIVYYPENVLQKPVLWTHSNDIASDVYPRYSYFSDIVVSDKRDIEKRMKRDKPCMITIKPQSLYLFKNLISQKFAGDVENGSVSLNSTEVTINKSGITKAMTVKTIADYCQTPLENILVAGNDQNDYPMLSLPVGKRFIVGQFLSGILTVPVTSVKNPQRLGSALYEFAKKLR